MFWTNWRELEKHNDWGVRGKDDDTAALWNENADGWERRTQSELEFNQRQVDALNIGPEDVVLDICCGTGPLTIPLAGKAKKVYAMDFNSNMLGYVRQKAEASGIGNIDYIQGNWNTLEPGIDYPIFDIAVTRHSPAQGNILKFSRCAKKYCYSLSNIYSPSGAFPPIKPGARWLKTAKETTNFDARPDGRYYGQNLHFNLLYEAGAHPEVRYVTNTTVLTGSTPEEVARKIFPHAPVDDLSPSLMEKIRKDGEVYIFEREQAMCIMGWDPSEIRYDLLERYGMV
ncbi:MAG: methyltransferase domain-containing protein [Oscillospiraceae bacterium]|nr:methyltransferase domain-containing protein [Oscillospiraceae bacterium]